MDLPPMILWRNGFHDTELRLLHAECFNCDPIDDDWNARVHRHSLGWVCARHGGNLVGFVNVAWDGAKHAFVLDLMVKTGYRHRGLATKMMDEVVWRTTESGCEWLHVDFEGGLRGFYIEAVGFRESAAGVMRLR